MDTGRDNTLGAGISIAIIVIAALVLLYILAGFLKAQKDIDADKDTFFGVNQPSVSGPQGGTQTPATSTKPAVSGSVDINIYGGDRRGDINEDNDNTTTSHDNSVKPSTNVAPVVSPSVSPTIPVELPIVTPIFNGLGL